MESFKLPKEWLQCVLNDLTEINPSKIKKDQDIISGFVPMSHAPTNYIGELGYEERLWGEISKSYTNFQNDDVILAKVTPCFENGKAAIVRNMPNGIGAGSSEFYVLRPRNRSISSRYIFALLKTREFMQEGAANMTGAVGLRRVPKAFVENFIVPLPSESEQKIIVDKLDDLLARVESIKTRLENIPETLKKFRQSVLSAAVSGKLTGVNASDYKEISSVAKVIGGLTKNGKRNQISQQFQYLRVANVYENELRLDDMSVIGVQDKELDRVLLHDGDILIVEGNGSLDQIGRAAIWNGEIENCVHQNHLIKVRVNDDINSKFLLYYFMSPQGKGEIVSKATSGAGLYTLSISKISSIKVPIYTVTEQISIVNATEQLFSYVDSIEKILDNTLSKINNLTQSILAKAFRGELTAQWREENPELISGLNSAEALLEKITAEKLAAGTIKKRGKKSSH